MTPSWDENPYYNPENVGLELVAYQPINAVRQKVVGAFRRGS